MGTYRPKSECKLDLGEQGASWAAGTPPPGVQAGPWGFLPPNRVQAGPWRSPCRVQAGLWEPPPGRVQLGPQAPPGGVEAGDGDSPRGRMQDPHSGVQVGLWRPTSNSECKQSCRPTTSGVQVVLWASPPHHLKWSASKAVRTPLGAVQASRAT